MSLPFGENQEGTTTKKTNEIVAQGSEESDNEQFPQRSSVSMIAIVVQVVQAFILVILVTYFHSRTV